MNEVTLSVGTPRLLEIQKGRKKALSFNVAFHIAEFTHLTQNGFRVVGGLISPPHTFAEQSTGRYFPTALMSRDLAQTLYRAVKNSGWQELRDPLVDPLYPEDIAISPLILTAVEAVFIMPKIVPMLIPGKEADAVLRLPGSGYGEASMRLAVEGKPMFKPTM